MGSLDIQSDQKVSEPELEIISNESEDSPTTSDKNDLLELMSESTSQSDSDVNELIVNSPPAAFDEDKASCSSSSMSSSDFVLEHPYQGSDNEHGENLDYTIESPPIQVMERSSPTTEKYRIPSSVFARKESTNTGWGMPSNESLFSIQMGMSFRNQDSLVWRPGELDLGFALEPSPSSKLEEIGTVSEFDEMGKTHEFSEEGRSHKLSEEDKIQSLSEISNNQGSSVVDKPVNPNLQDNQDDQGNESVVEELKSHFAAESGDRSSFAFPILTAETSKGPSARITDSAKTDSEPQAETHHEPEKQTQSSAASSWTNCFGCCTSCS